MDQEPDLSERVLEYREHMGEELLSPTARLAGTINKVPKKPRKQRLLESMAEAFEIIGGVPRLAHWGDQNPSEFYKLMGKTIPSMVQQVNNNQFNGPVQIVSALPPSSLDNDVIDVQPVPVALPTEVNSEEEQ